MARGARGDPPAGLQPRAGCPRCPTPRPPGVLVTADTRPPRGTAAIICPGRYESGAKEGRIGPGNRAWHAGIVQAKTGAAAATRRAHPCRRPPPAGGMTHRPHQRLNRLEKDGWGSRDRRVHSDPDRSGQAAMVAAALRDLPGVSETASLAGPYDVIARAQARHIDELAKPVTTGLQALDRVRRTMSCPASTCEEPIAVEHHTTIDEVGEGGAQAVCSCGWRSPVFGTGRRPARWTHYSARPMLAICTSGRCPCDNWCQVPCSWVCRMRRSGRPSS